MIHPRSVSGTSWRCLPQQRVVPPEGRRNQRIRSGDGAETQRDPIPGMTSSDSDDTTGDRQPVRTTPRSVVIVVVALTTAVVLGTVVLVIVFSHMFSSDEATDRALTAARDTAHSLAREFGK